MQRGRRDVARRKPKIAWQRRRMTPAVVSYYIQYDTKIVVEVVVAAAAALLQGGMINVARSKEKRVILHN